MLILHVMYKQIEIEWIAILNIISIVNLENINLYNYAYQIIKNFLIENVLKNFSLVIMFIKTHLF